MAGRGSLYELKYFVTKLCNLHYDGKSARLIVEFLGMNFLLTSNLTLLTSPNQDQELLLPA